MASDFINRLFHDQTKLKALPHTLVEVLRIARDEHGSADDLAGVLSKDPALTARLLKVVNSPFYGAGRSISSIRQAVVMLGTRQVIALAVSTSVYQMTDGWKPLFDRVRFWRHSLEVAIASRMIAKAAGYQNLEDVFVAGLLHDIGLLILVDGVQEEFRQVWKQSLQEGSLVDVEDRVWGTNHARVGQFLLEQWQLPESICQAVGHHHIIFTPGNNDRDMVPTQIVALANRISKFHIADNSIAVTPADMENRRILRENLGLSPKDLMDIERGLFSQTVNEARYLEMEIGSPEDIMNEANEILFEQYASVEMLLEENRRLQRQHAGDQVRSGYLESFRSTTSSFTQFLDYASRNITARAREVLDGISEGVIIDPKGLVAETIRDILRDVQSVNGVMEEMKGIVSPQASLNYDQSSVEEVADKISHYLDQIEEGVGAPT